MGVVQEAVDGRGREVLGHDGVEPGGVDVAGDGQAAAFVGGIDQAVEGFGGCLPAGQHADVVDDDEVGSGDAGDDLADRAVDGGLADGGGERLQGEPGHAHAVVDDLVGQEIGRAHV